MTKVIETEGIEKAIISSWKSWDGDVAYVSFGGVVLQPNVKTYLIDQALDLDLELFVGINFETSVVDISAYSTAQDEPEWTREFKLKASLTEVDEYITSQRYSL